MSGLPYSNMRSVLQEMPMQYGVSEGLGSGLGTALGATASMFGMPLLGAGVSLVGNILGQYMQNQNQIEMYNAYMSPQARMAQMRAAGINPNAAAQGISGSSSPGMTAAAPTSAFNGVGEQLGNSVNTALSAANIQASTMNTNADTKVLETTAEKNKSEKDYIDSLNLGQQIENKNRQDIINKTLRSMDDKHLIDQSTSRMFANDAALSDALFEGKIAQFWLNLAQMAQDLENAEAEHDRIISDIKKNYSDISLNAEYMITEEAKQRNINKETEIAEENRRFKAFRRNMISNYHFDPESSTEQNIAFALSIGDYETATYWAHSLGRFQADAQGFSEEKKAIVNQEFEGYKGLIGFCKFMSAGVAAGYGASASSAGSAKKTLDAWRAAGVGK